jgi:7-cyano-7-deazaguanine synthase
MCAIIGCIASSGGNEQAEEVLRTIFARSTERGRDGWGYRVVEDGLAREEHYNAMFYPAYDDCFFNDPRSGATLIGNLRAEPTTEYVKDKQASDQQPYRLGKWTIVHNGTIANDAELRTHHLPTCIDSAAIVEQLHIQQNHRTPARAPQVQFAEAIRRLKGSYAILATHDDEPGVIYTACNYRPIWWATDGAGVYFASSRDYFPERLHPIMIPPYSVWRYDEGGGTGLTHEPVPQPSRERALVVCSGGLDSVVAATKMVRDGYDVSLVHFRYGSRAEGPEDRAIWDVAEALGVGVWTRDMYIWEDTDSPLLQADSQIAGGEAGAEFAHEWVPARNLMMLAHATAMAEAKGFNLLVLGNNLEEAGAYPDNEPEFIQRFNDLLPFAIGDGKRLRVVMPVGNLMKHEIVALGLQLGAPLHLTWSCYRAGEQHCGTCGPCFMRRTAFEINGAPEVIRYANEGDS